MLTYLHNKDSLGVLYNMFSCMYERISAQRRDFHDRKGRRRGRKMANKMECLIDSKTLYIDCIQDEPSC